MWNVDSSSFIFQNPDVGRDTWFSVDMSSHQVSESSTFPLSIMLSEAEKQIFKANGVINASPDGKLLLYTEDMQLQSAPVNASPNNFRYVLANRTTREVAQLTVSPISQLSVENAVDIVWSDDSSGVVVSQISDDGALVVHFVAIPNLADLQTAVVSRFEAITTIDETSYYPYDAFTHHLFDVKAAGQVLISARQSNPLLVPNSETTVFVLWNPHQPEASQIIHIPEIEVSLALAVFSPQSENELLIWQQAGYGEMEGALYRFDINTRQLALLRQIEIAYSVMFSPFGEWMSYSTDTELVFLNMRAMLSTM